MYQHSQNHKSATPIIKIKTKTNNDGIFQKNYKRFIVLSLLLIGAIWVVRPSFFFHFSSFSSFSSSSSSSSSAAATAATAPPVKMVGGGGGRSGGNSQLRLDTLEILRKFN